MTWISPYILLDFYQIKRGLYWLVGELLVDLAHLTGIKVNHLLQQTIEVSKACVKDHSLSKQFIPVKGSFLFGVVCVQVRESRKSITSSLLTAIFD